MNPDEEFQNIVGSSVYDWIADHETDQVEQIKCHCYKTYLCFASRNIIRLWFEPLIINAFITMSRWVIKDDDMQYYNIKSSMLQNLVKKCPKGILKF